MLRQTHNSFTWIHIEKPTPDTIRDFRRQYPIENETAAELAVDTIRSKIEVFDHYVYLVLHFPVYNPRLRTVFPSELDIILHERSVATFGYKNLPFLEEFQHLMKSSVKRRSIMRNPAHFLIRLLETHFNFALRQLDHVKLDIDKIEGSIFQGKERMMVKELSLIRRDILDFRRIVNTHGPLLQKAKELLAKRYQIQSASLELIIDEYRHMMNLVDTYRETVEILYDTTESLLTIKTNEVMKLLTIFAVITFPLTLVATIFGMNTDYLPIIHELNPPWDFWVIFGLMVFGATVIYAFFKNRRWL